MWGVYMQCECVVATLVGGVLFMWVVYMQCEGVAATLVLGVLFTWTVHMQYEGVVATVVWSRPLHNPHNQHPEEYSSK